LTGDIDVGIWYALITFVLTVGVVNAINITDGLDGLVGGLMIIVLAVLAIITFISQRYLATTIIGIMLGSTLAFLWFNINPAHIFMGDS
jgi:phospho-N-acetylmuramoyl-pentapeptide-transferase